jgi:hypothetical protein
MFESLRSQFIRFNKKWKEKVKIRRNDAKLAIEMDVGLLSVLYTKSQANIDEQSQLTYTLPRRRATVIKSSFRKSGSELNPE